LSAPKRVILKNEVATLNRLHEIEEEMKVRQCKTQLKLETLITKAEAEKLAYEHTESKTAASEENKKSIYSCNPWQHRMKTSLTKMRHLLYKSNHTYMSP